MGWYLAPSLVVLRNEINARWPRRDRRSDGTIGDPAHQATKSDHNPNGRGSVNAIDIDEDGVDMGAIFAAVRRHPSARYWIYERRLYHRLRDWRAEPYDGVNPHTGHAHLSIDQTRQAEQDRRPWLLAGEDDDMPLSDTDLSKIRSATAKGIYDALHVAANRVDYRDLRYVGEGAIGASIRGNLTALTVAPVLTAIAAADRVEERALAAELAPALAAAVVAALPEDRDDVTVDELAEALRRVLGSVDGATPPS